ncbi:hypothetical protein CIPAW_06G157500 [Carya illinoinensis]|uniref:Integrase catalytic domain-containing protein n=1 Tax=Carya illinoinensis TaxID=32201 RepID=A0A8T1QCU1_CARIL|nr:hypothetical protein CIPAW_06G157500 [Carya illinoinensis]
MTILKLGMLVTRKHSRRLARSFIGKGGERANIWTLVRECAVCQTTKHETVKSAGLLQLLSIPHSPLLDIVMDFIGLPHSNGFSIILSMIDRLTKFAHFFSLSHPSTAVKVAQTFFLGVFKLHGMPKSIVFDKDPIAQPITHNLIGKLRA